MNTKVISGVALFLLLTGALFHQTFNWLFERYTAADSYYAHGFLVPVIAAYLAWLKKDELRRTSVSSSRVALALAVTALSVHSVSAIAGIYFLGGFTLLLFVFAASLWLFGKAVTRKLFFPFAFLLFMVPLPLAVVNGISFPLRLYVTKAAVAALHFTGLPIAGEGFRIIFPNDSLVVGNPCSGLRSLIALTAMGSVFAYLLKASTAKKALLFAAAVPIALFSNFVRLIALCLATYLFGSASIQGLFHDATGYAVFVIAFSVLWYAWKELGKGRGDLRGAV